MLNRVVTYVPGGGGPHAGKTPVLMALVGSFHGRTERAAQASHASGDTYRASLATWLPRGRAGDRSSSSSSSSSPPPPPLPDDSGRQRRAFDVDDFFRPAHTATKNAFHQSSSSPPHPPCVFVTPNDVADLREAFDRCDAEGFFVEAMLLEPCMGEGDPGTRVTPEFYDEARRLTTSHGSMLVVDSVQAGLRAAGELSVLDYPGFGDCEPPDFEIFSKALNGGQFPLSVVAFSGAAAEAYRSGIYGNTMAFNPRASRVGAAALRSMTPALRRNIVDRGEDFTEALSQLAKKYPEYLGRVVGSGLLVGLHVDPSVRVTGGGGLEERCRRMGLNVVHGGVNALRFTPWFHVTPREIAIVVGVVEEALNDYLSDYGMMMTTSVKDEEQEKKEEKKEIEEEEEEDVERIVEKISAWALVEAANDRMEKKIAVARLVVEAAMNSFLARNPNSARAFAAVTNAGSSSSSSSSSSFEVPLDHIGFRTFDVDGMGIASIANLFESLGYVEAADGRPGDGPMTFPEKKIFARWYRPPPANPPLPRVFISEIRVDELSPEAQSIVKAYVSATSASSSSPGSRPGGHGGPLLFSTDPASAALPYDCPTPPRWEEEEVKEEFAAASSGAGCHLRYPGAFATRGFTSQRFQCVIDVIRDVYAVAGDFAAGAANYVCCGGATGHGTPWDAGAVSVEEYETLARESEYAAWTLMNGYALNHAAIAVHRLPSESGMNTLVGMNNFVRTSTSCAAHVQLCRVDGGGGAVWPDMWSRVSPDGGLRQSSTAADLVERPLFSELDGEFRAGTKIPAGYLEFVERRSLEFPDMSPDVLRRQEHLLRDGFFEGNADGIFESTYESARKTKKENKETEMKKEDKGARPHVEEKEEKEKETEKEKAGAATASSTTAARGARRRFQKGNIISRVRGNYCVYPPLLRHPRGAAMMNDVAAAAAAKAGQNTRRRKNRSKKKQRQQQQLLSRGGGVHTYTRRRTSSAPPATAAAAASLSPTYADDDEDSWSDSDLFAY